MYILLTYFSREKDLCKQGFFTRKFLRKVYEYVCSSIPQMNAVFYPVISEKSILICLLKNPIQKATLVTELIKRSRAKSDFIT